MRRKLYSPKGTYLGVVTYPQKWDDQLMAFGTVKIAMHEPFQEAFSKNHIPVKTSVRSFTISHAPWEEGAIVFQGITPEQFERLPLCSFEISISYLRSIMP